MRNGKTRITVEIDDCNLLRLRILLLCDDVKGSGENLSLSEYLNEYLTRTIPHYAQDMSEEIADTFNPKLRLLEELADLKTDWFDQEMNIYCELPEEVYNKEYSESERDVAQKANTWAKNDCEIILLSYRNTGMVSE